MAAHDNTGAKAKSVSARLTRNTKGHSIHHVPLVFLFIPTLLTAVVIYCFFHFQLQSRVKQQLEDHGNHLLIQVTQLTEQALLDKHFAELKQQLWRFAQSAGSGIENIVVYDGHKELVTALNLDEQVIDTHLDVLPQQALYKQDGVYHLWGRVAPQATELNAMAVNDSELVAPVGYLWITFNYDAFELDSYRNLVVVIAITIMALFLGAMLWRYRYAHYNRQLVLIVDALINLNKGFKHVKLPEVKGYNELNLLQQQLNRLVGYFEKRLTMKQFEVSALEQTLNQTQDKLQAKEGLLSQTKAQFEQSKKQSTGLASEMYSVCYQRIQQQLATIEKAVFTEAQGSADGQAPAPLISASFNGLNQTLGELKALSDVVKGQGRANLDYVALEQLLESLTTLVKPLAQAKGLEFFTALPTTPVSIEVDVQQLQKVVVTLLQSAISVTEQGFIKLSFDVLPLAKPDESGHTHSLCAQILDTSSGLSLERYKLLNNDQVDGALAQDDWLETGLDLLVAKKTIEAMLGHFQVKSLSGRGCEFTLSLPCRYRLDEPFTQVRLAGCRVMLFDQLMQRSESIIQQFEDIELDVIHCTTKEHVFSALNAHGFCCGIFIRPSDGEGQLSFDELLKQVASSGRLKQGYILTDDGTCGIETIPQDWQLAEKPFRFSAFMAYLKPKVTDMMAQPELQKSTLSERQVDILAVDDNETNLKLLAIVLRDLPVNLVTALSGREALAHCRRQQFDVVLMDKEMPDMDGLESCAAIRRLPMHQQTPLVLFTAHLEDQEKQQCLGQVVDDCLVKPLDPEKFDYLMTTWCQSRWQQITALRKAEH